MLWLLLLCTVVCAIGWGRAEWKYRDVLDDCRHWVKVSFETDQNRLFQKARAEYWRKRAFGENDIPIPVKPDITS